MTLLLFLALLALPAGAGEGMWMPQQVPQLGAELQRLGLKFDANKLADLTGDPLGAVVQLPGCTAAFVSPDGLIATNHHCAFSSIQYNATPERDLIEKGFIAHTRAEELPAAPGTKVWVTTKIEDVTARLMQAAGAAGRPSDDVARSKQIDRREKELIAECEKPGGVRCKVSSFFEGSQYLRLTQSEISDVRLVYAPARAIGEYGGEVDNFMWPRHTGDFSFYRAYVDGQPYHPKQWLKVSTEGVDAGDLVIVAGYPGRTFRYKTADEVRNYQEFVYPANIRYFTDVIAILENASKESRAIELRNTSRIKSLANALKNYTSVNEGFTKDRIAEARVAREDAMRKAIASDPSLAKYAKTLDDIARVNAASIRMRERDLVLVWLLGTPASARSSPMLTQALRIVRLAQERPRKDVDRLAGYQERDWSGIRQTSDRTQRVIDAGSDRAAVRYVLEAASKLPAEQRIKAIDDAVAAAGGIDPFVTQLYASTKIADQAERTKMLSESSEQLAARNDAMLKFVTSLLPLVAENEELELATTGAMTRLRPGYFELLRKVSGPNLYPDANSTLRVTFGRVEGYTPRDATTYTPQTTLRGIVEKEKGEEPFASPKPLLQAAADATKTKAYADPEIGDVPVNFLSTCDTTGGNSGSPTLNAKGEFIGLLFDGNYESIDADFLFNPATTRSIHVDVVYALWVMDAVDGAHELMRELGVTPKFAR